MDGNDWRYVAAAYACAHFSSLVDRAVSPMKMGACLDGLAKGTCVAREEDRKITQGSS